MSNKVKPESDLSNLLDGIKELLSGYIDRKLELYKLKTFEKVAVSGSFLGYTLIVVLLVFNIFILSLLTLGFFIGQLLHNSAAGFGVLIVVSLFALLMFVLCRRKFRMYLVNLIVRIIRKIETDDEE